MRNALPLPEPTSVSRRSFLKRVAVGAAAVALFTLLSRRPFGGAGRDQRSIPANLPGEGSIFQPRNDSRSR